MSRMLRARLRFGALLLVLLGVAYLVWQYLIQHYWVPPGLSP